MEDFIISGIQQIGIGVSHVYEAWEWYRKHLGMDTAIFDEAAEAALMLPYTGGEPRSRHAVFALNPRGGSGLEIWQYTSRLPVGPASPIRMGDLGILSIKYKSPNVLTSQKRLLTEGVQIVSKVESSPVSTCYGKDSFGNLFEIVQDDHWFKNDGKNGGVFGCSIGVSDMEKSIQFYIGLLGYNEIIFDQTAQFEDFNNIDGQPQTYRRVILTHSENRKGPFANLFGPSQIELVQVLDREPKKVYENRLWGDLGYIHLCFDVFGMDNLKAKSESLGHPFTVDSSSSFDMGEAAGRFTYIEDPDGTLIEFVETHKIPLVKKIGWYFDLQHRDHEKPLPNLLLKGLFLNRSKKPVYP